MNSHTTHTTTTTTTRPTESTHHTGTHIPGTSHTTSNNYPTGTTHHTGTGNTYPAGTTGTIGTDTTPTTGSTANAHNRGAAAGQGAKGIFAKGHGIGEAIRGNINSAIDGFTGDKASLAKNEQVAQGGEREFRTGQFEKRGTTDKAI